MRLSVFLNQLASAGQYHQNSRLQNRHNQIFFNFFQQTGWRQCHLSHPELLRAIKISNSSDLAKFWQYSLRVSTQLSVIAAVEFGLIKAIVFIVVKNGQIFLPEARRRIVK